MKKSLIALAALGAFAGSAMAQSSVTLFGVVDLAVGNVDNDGGGSKYLMTTNGNASSRLGVRGVEDLGGGLRAGFWLEGDLSADNGTASTSNFWGRRSTLSLISNWGELRLGRDYTPTYNNFSAWDPFGTVGFAGAGQIVLEVAGQFLGSSYATFVRADNSIGYILPAGLGGLYGQAMVSAGEGVVGNKYYGGRLGWASGPFNVGGAYSQTEVPLGDMGLTLWNLGGSWDFGFMKLSGYYGSIELDNAGDQTNWYVGAWVPFGPWTIKGSYGSVERDANLASRSGDATMWALGFTYDLSKRTVLYGTYSSIDNDGNVNFRVFGGANAPTQALGGDSTGWQFGVRHSF